jgi:hypothetical protein
MLCYAIDDMQWNAVYIYHILDEQYLCIDIYMNYMHAMMFI